MHVLEYEKSQVKLDLKDKKILALLSINARTPHSAIAKEVMLSPEAVSYRIERLKERKVLLGTRTVVAAGKLGLSSYHLFLSLHPPNLSHEAQYVQFFQNDNRVNAALQYLGRRDFEISVVVRNPKEFDEFRLDLSHQCKNIQEEQIVQVLDTIKSTALPEKIFPDVKFHYSLPKRYKDVAIDDEDKRLLVVLADNADLRIDEIAKRAKLTRDQVTYRMKKLQEQGVIVEYRPVINYAALGYSVHAVLFTFQSRSHEREQALRQSLRDNPSILWAVRTLGEWDLLLYIISKDNNDFYRTIVELREKFSDIIKNYETLIAYREYKYTYLPKQI